MKQVVFNVGGALSTYIEFDNKKIIIDIGKSAEFNPIVDFLKPLFEQRGNLKFKDTNEYINSKNEKKINDSDKFYIDQLIISHPHNDHISNIIDFDKYFYPSLITCPNDKEDMPEGHKMNWSFFDNNNSNVKKLKEMISPRFAPLTSAADGNLFIYYIPPEFCEKSIEMNNEKYENNISLAIFMILSNYRIFLPGDLMKIGMKTLIENEDFHLDKDSSLKSKLKSGVDVLIAPHHGLESSFSTDFFNNIKDKKVRCLNIISEKVNNTDESRTVDSRYSKKEYCFGNNNLEGGNGIEECYQFKTSRGHLFIDYSNKPNPYFEIIRNNDGLIKKFI